jgi:energy-coupling factor transport system substrate-specific component
MQIVKLISLPVLFLCMVALLWLSVKWSDNYILPSFGLVVLAIVIILIRFEKRKLEARELVLLAVIAAIAAIGRVPFASIPSVQPTTFIIMMSGFVFGAESGFIIGAVAALASNMILGQGPWTPWQMVAWGLVGMTAGILGKHRYLATMWGRILFGIVWGFLFGWIMNLWSLLAFSQAGTELTLKTVLLYMTSSAVHDFMHSIANVIFILLFSEFWIKILSRFKKKYGLLET